MGKKKVDSGPLISIWIDLKHHETRPVVAPVHSDCHRHVLIGVVRIGRIARFSTQDVYRGNATFGHAFDMPCLLRSE